MRKNKFFAAAFAGMLALGLAGCGNHTQTAGKESGMPAQAIGRAMESLADAEESIAIKEALAAKESVPPETIPEPVEVPETQTEQTAEEKTAGAEPEQGNAAASSAQEVPKKLDEPQEPESSQTAAPPIQEPAQTEAPPPAEPAETEPPAPEPVETEPSVPKSIYDYEFDIEAIRQELIALGEGMGLTHTTTDDGRAVTPDNASWATPVTASESFQGANLERKLKDYVQSMPGIITAYGGNAITLFTIYTEPLGGGSYRIYFLY